MPWSIHLQPMTVMAKHASVSCGFIKTIGYPAGRDWPVEASWLALVRLRAVVDLKATGLENGA